MSRVSFKCKLSLAESLRVPGVHTHLKRQRWWGPHSRCHVSSCQLWTIKRSMQHRPNSPQSLRSPKCRQPGLIAKENGPYFMRQRNTSPCYGSHLHNLKVDSPAPWCGVAIPMSITWAQEVLGRFGVLTITRSWSSFQGVANSMPRTVLCHPNKFSGQLQEGNLMLSCSETVHLPIVSSLLNGSGRNGRVGDASSATDQLKNRGRTEGSVEDRGQA